MRTTHIHSALVLLVAIPATGCPVTTTPRDAGTLTDVTSVSDAPTQGDDAHLPSGDVVVDCTEPEGSCAPIVIGGDSPAMPGPGEPDVRGYADPSIRADPETGRLWMAYSVPRWEGGVVRVDDHLAHSDDGGASWQYDRVLWASSPETEIWSGREGFSNHETVTLAPRVTPEGVLWYYARMRYFTRAPDGYMFVTFTTRVGRASSPLEIGTAPEDEENVLGGAMTPTPYAAYDLSTLSPDLEGCTFFDAGLLWSGDRLHMLVECLRFVGREEDPSRGLVAMFSSAAEGEPAGWTWRYDGTVADHDDAVALGGETLLQADLTMARDGTPLAILSPSAPGGVIADHFGCVVVPFESLDEGRVGRDASGVPLVRARFLDEDGTAACTYDTRLDGGLVMVRRRFGRMPLLLSVELLSTGVHP